MQKLVYYVAMSLDGFIAGENEDVSGFIYTGKGVETYLQELKNFKTVIMGRSTYEFGYKFGVKPGEPSPAYPHMKQFIVSNSLEFENPHPQVKIIKDDDILSLKENAESAIYLCGGGKLAGWLVEKRLLDEVKIKLNPVIFGTGVKLFEGISSNYGLELLENLAFEDGMVILHYKVHY